MSEHNEQPRPTTTEPFCDKISRVTANCCRATGLCCFKTKEKTLTKPLEFKLSRRRQEFGIDYLNLIDDRAPPKELKSCLAKALQDINELKGKIAEHEANIEAKTEEVQEQIVHAPGGTDPSANRNDRRPAASKKPSKTKPSQRNGEEEDYESDDDDEEEDEPPVTKASSKQKPSKSSKPSGGGGGGKPSSSSKPKPNKKKPHSNKANDDAEIPEEYKNVDPSKWHTSQVLFAGGTSYDKRGKYEEVKGQSIPDAIEHFEAHPERYIALLYQTSMLEWPAANHEYALVHRKGTERWHPTGLSKDGWMTCHLHEYHVLPRFEKNLLPKAARDSYTDKMTFQGKRLHSSKRPAFLPGRGMGIADTPLLKIIGDVDPSDIAQGQVGNCWMLSGISSLAEFDGAITKLFRKTPNIEQRPFDGPNMYTVTLWDLKTWTEVDIHIDERLAASPDYPGQVLASKPSEDGELWVSYLEKALAVHCGGWDKIVGGQCTHAWSLLTGCKDQYQISPNKATGKYMCMGKKDPYKHQWLEHANSPHDCDGTNYPVPWPEVGGGGNEELTKDELFLRLYAWDQVNYIVAAGTRGSSDKKSTGGVVDNHAYSVIESVHNAAGTGIDLLKVRNPWGQGEIEDGEFDDDGPGWDKYPQIKKLLKPVVADDGIFWVTKEEFFEFFETIYLSASNMTEFLED